MQTTHRTNGYPQYNRAPNYRTVVDAIMQHNSIWQMPTKLSAQPQFPFGLHFPSITNFILKSVPRNGAWMECAQITQNWWYEAAINQIITVNWIAFHRFVLYTVVCYLSGNRFLPSISLIVLWKGEFWKKINYQH